MHPFWCSSKAIINFQLETEYVEIPINSKHLSKKCFCESNSVKRKSNVCFQLHWKIGLRPADAIASQKKEKIAQIRFKCKNTCAKRQFLFHTIRDLQSFFALFVSIQLNLKFFLWFFEHDIDANAAPAQYPYKANGGYASEPERNYDSDHSIKYKTLDRRHNQSSNRYVTNSGANRTQRKKNISNLCRNISYVSIERNNEKHFHRNVVSFMHTENGFFMFVQKSITADWQFMRWKHQARSKANQTQKKTEWIAFGFVSFIWNLFFHKNCVKLIATWRD